MLLALVVPVQGQGDRIGENETVDQEVESDTDDYQVEEAVYFVALGSIDDFRCVLMRCAGQETFIDSRICGFAGQLTIHDGTSPLGRRYSLINMWVARIDGLGITE